VIGAEMLDEWQSAAESDAETTRAPSGYYPSARILALLAEVARLTEELSFEQSLTHEQAMDKASGHLREENQRLRAGIDALIEMWECEPPDMHTLQHLHRSGCPGCWRADSLRGLIRKDESA